MRRHDAMRLHCYVYIHGDQNEEESHTSHLHLAEAGY
jgi:hypothetical protein